MKVYFGHPRQGDDEYLVGFFPESTFNLMPWERKRMDERPIQSCRKMGKVTYAVFVSKDELVEEKGKDLEILPIESFEVNGKRNNVFD